MAPTNHNTDSPAWRPDYWQSYLSPLWERVGDVFSGLHTEDQKRKYLRQQLGEHDKTYEARVETVAYENRLSPSVKAHAGLLSEFEIDEDAPVSLVENRDNVDGQLNSIEAFLLDWDISALLYNAALCLVDAPIAETVGEQHQQRTPRLVNIPLKDVFAPAVILDNGMLKIARISIRRSTSVPDGAFGYQVKDQFWVYTLRPLPQPINRNGNLQTLAAFFEVWEEEDAEDNQGKLTKFVPKELPRPLFGADGQPLESIPVVWYSPYGDPLLFYGVDNMADRGGTPEYMPLVDLNIEYFNKHSELNSAESRGNFVMMKLSYPGPRPKTIPDLVTSGRMAVTDGGATLELLEPSGSAIASTREGQRDRLKRMDAISQSFLTGGEVERTATEAVIETSQSRLGLRNIARRKESAVQHICYWWDRYINPDFQMGDSIGGITVSESVLAMPPTADDIRAVESLFVNSVLTQPQAIDKLIDIGYLPAEILDESLPEPTFNLNFSGANDDDISERRPTQASEDPESGEGSLLQ